MFTNSTVILFWAGNEYGFAALATGKALVGLVKGEVRVVGRVDRGIGAVVLWWARPRNSHERACRKVVDVDRSIF